MSSSYSYTESSAFTITHARHFAEADERRAVLQEDAEERRLGSPRSLRRRRRGRRLRLGGNSRAKAERDQRTRHTASCHEVSSLRSDCEHVKLWKSCG